MNWNPSPATRFKPGLSGNGYPKPPPPPKLSGQVREATHQGRDIVALVLEILNGTATYKQAGHPDRTVPVKPELRLEAARWLADRGWGKAVELIADVTDTRIVVIRGEQGLPELGPADSTIELAPAPDTCGND